jgi:hypothetical protein
MRYRNVNSGALVSVRDDKVLDAEWESLDDEGSSSTEAAGYQGMKVADLKGEIDSRNEGREEADLLSTEGRKADLVATLEADDAASNPAE